MALTKIRERKSKPEPPLSDRKRKFAHEYAVDLNAKRAALAAGYDKKTASVMAHKLLKDPVVMKEIARLEGKALKKIGLNKEMVLQELYYLATRSIKEFVDEHGDLLPANKLSVRAAACVDSIKQKTRTFIDQSGEEQTIKEVEYRLSGKATAIDMAMKHFGQYAAEQHEHKHAVVNWDDQYVREDDSKTIDEVEYRILNPQAKIPESIPPKPDTNAVLRELMEESDD